MSEHDHKQQDAERIMRRASDLGLDPDRVGRALNHPTGPSADLERTAEVDEPAGFAYGLLRRLRRRA